MNVINNFRNWISNNYPQTTRNFQEGFDSFKTTVQAPKAPKIVGGLDRLDTGYKQFRSSLGQTASNIRDEGEDRFKQFNQGFQSFRSDFSKAWEKDMRMMKNARDQGVMMAPPKPLQFLREPLRSKGIFGKVLAEVITEPDEMLVARKKLEEGIPLTKEEKQMFDNANMDMLMGTISAPEAIGKEAITPLKNAILRKGQLLTDDALSKLDFLIHGKDNLVKAFNFRPYEAELVRKAEYEVLQKAKTVDEAMKITNAIRARINKVEAAKFKDLPANFINSFQDWVNGRRTVQMTSYNVKKMFEKLDPEKQVDNLEGMFKYQAGDQSHPMFQSLKNYFDQKWEILNKAGVLGNQQYKQNYLSQLWLDKDGNTLKNLPKSLKTKGGFTFEAVIDSYRTGIQKLGLTPKFTSLSSIASDYERVTSRMLEDKRFFDFLVDQGFVLPESKAPRHWKRLTDAMPTASEMLENGKVIQLPFKAPARVAETIKNYMEKPSAEFLNDFALHASSSKNRVLSMGLPEKWGQAGLNYFGATQWVRSVLAADNPMKAMWRTTSWMLKSDGARQFLEQNMDEATKLSKAGLNLSVEDWKLGQVVEEIEGGLIKKGLIKADRKYQEIFGDRMFNELLPAIKLQWATEYKNSMLASGMTEKEAYKTASKVANTIFGGINLEEMARDRNFQNILRTTILAPDFLESIGRTGVGVAKGFTTQLNNPAYKAYRTFIRNFVLTYAGLNVINQTMSGKWMWENPNPFELDTNLYAGNQKLYIKPFAGGVDFIRLPVEMAQALLTNDSRTASRIIRNRLSIPAGAGVGIITNTDYLGRPLKGATGVGGQILSGAGTPGHIVETINLASGQATLPEFITSLMEAPVRWRSERYQSTYSKELRENGMDTSNYLTLISAGEDPQKAYEIAMKAKGKKVGFWEKVGLGLRGMFGAAPKETDPLTQAYLADAALDDQKKEIKELFAKGYSTEELKKQLEKRGYSYDQAAIDVAKSLSVESGIRPIFIHQFLAGMESSQLNGAMEKLIESSVLTSDVLDYWYQSGMVSEAQFDQLKAFMKTVKNKGKSSSGRKVGSVSLKSGKAPTIPELKIPTAQIKPVNIDVKPDSSNVAMEYKPGALPEVHQPETNYQPNFGGL